MTLDQAMSRLESLGSEQMRKINTKNGVNENQFGVKMGDIRALAKEIKLDPDLAKQLWETGNFDAMVLSTLVTKPKLLTADDIDALVRSIPYVETATFSQVADYLITNVVKPHPDKEELRLKWMESKDLMPNRCGWSLTAERVAKNPEGLDVKALLDRIEKEMGTVPKLHQWTMNFCLMEIGIHFPELRERVIAVGEKIGAFRDYPVSKGCVSPYVPICVPEMVRRMG